MTSEGPESPISPLLADALNMKQLMDTWIEAGFSPEQAFAMVLEMLRATITRGNS